MRLFIAALFVLLLLPARAQNPFYRKTDVAVTAGGNLLQYAWTGGLNNPQFSEADINNDGTADLVIFDRSGEILLTFLNGGTPNQTDYTYAPEYEPGFPQLHNWALLLDFNCDQIPDLFTSANGDGIMVYTGQYTETNHLTFTLFDTQLTFPPDETNVYVAIYDIPAITDVDNDGDIDVLSFGSAGGFVKYYRNKAEENGQPCGTLQLELETDCWGNFYESGINTSLFLETSCLDGLAGNHQHSNSDKSGLHPGSTLLAIDLDPAETSNGAKELILGDISYANFVMTTNGGTLQTANMIAQDTLFPSYNAPVLLTTFPAGFSVDVNNDGLKDLIAAPNTVAQSEHYRCAWLYHNNGNPTQQFEWITDRFMADNMIDVSRLANPAFFDYNSDGLLDLVITNFGYMDEGGDFSTALSLYRNTGTPTQPAFELVSDNYSNIAAQFAIPRLGLRPTFGDLDNDGDRDMLLGDKDGYIHYFKNNPNPDGTANFTLFQEQFQGLDVFQYSTPQLVDINKDGLLDLIIGHHNGALRYFQNNGTPTNPVFNAATPTNSFFGGVDVKEVGSPTGYSAPQLIDYNGSFMLFCGSESGKIHVYNNIEENIATGGLFTKITDDLLGTHIGIRANPAIADLNNDGYLDMVVGTYNGGLYWFSEGFPINIAAPAMQQNPVLAYPNPANNLLVLQWPQTSGQQTPAHIWLYDPAGRQLLYRCITPASQEAILNLPQLPAGLYFAKIVQNRQTFTAKVYIKP
ncbi:T9SS C-terminal target domain-containing protein [Sphingobacteriales bacterium UPWRP_1]|nr:hypothetical protein B6N25_09440 [Sphingobacteriales bacterium TSM_CSS]PSJ77503.1 T9SS C-terminal target domain-containing protein [Sphingobacteriales bacterium UPWRP_1]